MPDLVLQIIGSDGASAAFRGAAAGFQELAKVAFDCTKAFEEQAKADRQLERYAKELTPAFKAQAAAMQETLGVSDDVTQSMQTMLLRFGEAPDQVDATVRALLDYSAATGEDAVSATRTLLGAVNSGKAVFKDLGLEYEKTGKKSADLQAITVALAGKLGGSAQAEANSVAGQARIAKAAVDEFKESIGKLISDMAQKTNIVGRFTEVIKDLNEALTGDKAQKAHQHTLKMMEKRANLRELTDAVADAETDLQQVMRSPGAGPTQVERAVEQLKTMKGLLATAEADFARFAQGGAPGKALPGLAGPDALTNKAQASAEKQSNDNKLSDFESYAEAKVKAEFQLADDTARALAQLDADREKAARDDFERNAKELVDEDKKFEERRKQIAKLVEYELKVEDDKLKAAAKASDKLEDQLRRQNERTQEMMASAATQIGVAFINNLSEALASAAAGEEVDGVDMALDVMGMVLGLAGTLVGTYFGGAAGGALGGALGSGIGTVAKGAYKGSKKHHDGGWVEPQYFHGGGWAMGSDEQAAILKRDERVLSEREVGNMGGKAAVDRAARGGSGGVTFNVSTLDSQSFTGWLGDTGGRGFYNAMRLGRGQLAQAVLG